MKLHQTIFKGFHCNIKKKKAIKKLKFNVNYYLCMGDTWVTLENMTPWEKFNASTSHIFFKKLNFNYFPPLNFWRLGRPITLYSKADPDIIDILNVWTFTHYPMVVLHYHTTIMRKKYVNIEMVLLKCNSSWDTLDLEIPLPPLKVYKWNTLSSFLKYFYNYYEFCFE